MKIGFLIDELAPGSTPKLIGWPIRKLAELGVDAEALVIIQKDHWQRHPDHYRSHLGNIKIRYLFSRFPKLLQRLNFKFPGMSFFSLHHIVSGLFSHKSVQPKEFDIIVACCQYTTFGARNLLKRRKIPFLFLIWDPSTYTAKKIYKDRFGWKFPFLYLAAMGLDRYALKKCKAVITSGRFHHPHLAKLTDKPLEILAPGCFPLETLPPFAERRRMILTFDRWDIGNVPDIFLDILQGIKQNDVILTIGGFWHPESLKEQFQSEVRKRGLEKRVELLGPLDEKQIRELASQAYVHVHPVHEAFGMQTLEAAGCGCPGVIPAGSGAAELFENGVSGFHPPIGDKEAMIGCIRQLFESPKLAESMGHKAFQVAQRYTWGNYAKTLVRIAEKYLDHKANA